jgi:proline iminopeptidase
LVVGHGPLVFVTSPGWGSSSLYLQKGLSPLKEQFTLLFLDTRGSGGSSRPADSTKMSTSVMADDVDRVRDYLGIDSIILVGHSNGGAIALDYAERYPTRLRKLVLLDAEVLDDRAEKATGEFLRLWGNDPRYKSAVQTIHDDPRLDTDEDFSKFLNSILPLYLSDPDHYLMDFAKTFEGTHLAVYAAKAQEAADKLFPRKQSKEYDRVRAKTLILSGTVDWVCPTEVSERIHAGIRGSTLSLYANAGHFLWIEQPKRFFAELTSFLAD